MRTVYDFSVSRGYIILQYVQYRCSDRKHLKQILAHIQSWHLLLAVRELRWLPIRLSADAPANQRCVCLLLRDHAQLYK